MKIVGNTTCTTTPRPDWAETDPQKASFIENKPEGIKNPKALVFTGAVSASYDGGEQIIVDIPIGGGEGGGGNGASAYEIALQNGFEGTEEEWIASLQGKTAYQFAQDGGYAGSEEEFAEKLATEYRPATWTPSAEEVGALSTDGGTLSGSVTVEAESASGTGYVVKKTVNGVEHKMQLYVDTHGLPSLSYQIDGAEVNRMTLKSAGTGFVDPVEVAGGGTGKATHTANAVLTGNGTSAVKNVATASGALYATAANGAPKFGVLPYAQGGTGKALGDVPNYAIMRNAGDGDYMWYTATGNGALFATAANGVPKFGTLPVKQGGTGATSEVAARKALGTNMKLLWKNASPTSTFESFTPLTNSDLAESLANFTAIIVWFNVTPEATQHSFSIIPIGIGSGTDTDDVKNTTLCFATGDNKWVRRYGWATTSAITFGTGGYKTSLSANWTVNSKYMVPERIYGVR